MDVNSLPNDPAALKELIANLAAQHHAELSDKAGYISQLEEQVRLLKAILHLAKSERQAPANCRLSAVSPSAAPGLGQKLPDGDCFVNDALEMSQYPGPVTRHGEPWGGRNSTSHG